MSEYRDNFRDIEREGWWTGPRVAFMVFALLLFGFAMTFVSDGLDLVSFKFWAPKMENAKRDVYINTNSYIMGKNETLSNLRMAYQSEDKPARKNALKVMILEQASNVDNSKLDPDLQTFIRDLKAGTE